MFKVIYTYNDLFLGIPRYICLAKLELDKNTDLLSIRYLQYIELYCIKHLSSIITSA